SHSRMPEYDRNERDIRRFAESDSPVAVLSVTSEEVGEREDVIEAVVGIADRYGIEARLSSDEEFLAVFAGEHIDRLKAGVPDPGDVDPRTDWNPACTGVYVTRIELKRLSRELEGMLLACEALSAVASDHGFSYPVRKFGRLWGKMALLHFHDAITSTHADGAYDELIELCSGVALETARVSSEAMAALERDVTVPKKDGYAPFIVFNPLAWEVRGALVESSLLMGGGEDLSGIGPSLVEVIDHEGARQDVHEAVAVRNHYDQTVTLRFRADSLPSLGYGVYYFKVGERVVGDGCRTPRFPKVTQLRPNGRHAVENGFYRVETEGHDIAGIFDKKIGEYVLGRHAGDLTIEDDIGSPWETLMTPIYRHRLIAPYSLEDALRPGHTVGSEAVEGESGRIIRRWGTYANEARRMRRVEWMQEITLHDGIDEVLFRTVIDWDCKGSRIRMGFPLTFRPADDEGFYEIPFGTVRRRAYAPSTGGYTCRNGDWPALGFVACHNGRDGYTVGILNGGTPGHAICDGVISVSLLRSPQEAFCAFAFEGASDSGRHEFSHALVSGAGGLKDVGMVRKAREHRAAYISHGAGHKDAGLPARHSFVSNKDVGVVISSVKRAEKGGDLIVRAYEAYGEPADDALTAPPRLGSGGAEVCDLLEAAHEGQGPSATGYGPFEIKTLRLR
ncbi:MAG: glycosyl hydrolase-related protein, partial [Oscillospiraceae bacterium]|nr:glycosyl hydrolase-related protein [Oscillospiraceae bacterium]